MNKFKKFLTVALAATMVMGMSATAMAEEVAPVTATSVTNADILNRTSTITVTNISSEKESSVKLYKIASVTVNGVDVEKWAEDFVSAPTEGNNRWTVNNEDGLVTAAKDPNVNAITSTTSTTSSVEFKDVAPGSYLILIDQEGAEYNPMIVSNYDATATNADEMVTDQTVVAKGSDKTINKTADDYFVANGQEVTFEIKTTVPYFASDITERSFVISDKPENLVGLKFTKVTIGNETVYDVDSQNATDVVLGEDNGVFTVDLSKFVKTDEYVGMTVVVTATATVSFGDQFNPSNDFAYKNEAWSNTSAVDADKNPVPTTVTGYTGVINIVKMDAVTRATLSGAKFSLTKKNAEAAEETSDNTVYAVKIGNDNGKYKVVAAGTTGAGTEFEVDGNGQLIIEGLAEGVYEVTETKAPIGYAINKTIENITISVPTGEGNIRTDANEIPMYEANVPVYSEVLDTTLATLPFTGGTGTTMFTIIGVVIMVVAAALFFASRRKSK